VARAGVGAGFKWKRKAPLHDHSCSIFSFRNTLLYNEVEILSL